MKRPEEAYRRMQMEVACLLGSGPRPQWHQRGGGFCGWRIGKKCGNCAENAGRCGDHVEITGKLCDHF